MNMTLLNMVHSMMFWDDAVLCAIYLRNKSYTHAINDKTPNEMWHGHIPLVINLRVLVPLVMP